MTPYDDFHGDLSIRGPVTFFDDLEPIIITHDPFDQKEEYADKSLVAKVTINLKDCPAAPKTLAPAEQYRREIDRLSQAIDELWQQYLVSGLKYSSVPLTIQEHVPLPPDVEWDLVEGFSLYRIDSSFWDLTNTIIGISVFMKARYFIAITNAALQQNLLREVQAVLDLAADAVNGWEQIIDSLVASVDDYIAISNASMEWPSPDEGFHRWRMNQVAGEKEDEKCRNWAEAQSLTVKSMSEMTVVLRVVNNL
jgi:hypothetical protein